MNTRWQKPVLIAFETPGDYTSIETTQAASWALIEDWPIEDGDALDKALLICAAVDAGKKAGGCAQGLHRRRNRGRSRHQGLTASGHLAGKCAMRRENVKTKGSKGKNRWKLPQT